MGRANRRINGSEKLRKNKAQHAPKNGQSSKMEDRVSAAVQNTLSTLQEEYPDIIFNHQKRMTKEEIYNRAVKNFPELKDHFQSPVASGSFIKPDGGFITANINGKEEIILISEAKRQGTNTERAKEGKPRQSKGNAIERLGKNVTEVRSIFASEEITPFVCFGEGEDFSKDSSILDRVLSINHNMLLNHTYVKRTHPFQPVSLYFREEPWQEEDMETVFLDVARQAIEYYKER